MVSLFRKFSGFAFLLCVLGAMWVLMTRGYRDESPTEDEWAHTIRGISFWQQEDTRLHYAHPPLGNAITGLAVGRDPNNPRLDKMTHWKEANVGLTALEYIKKDYPRAREQLFATRRVAMGFGIALAAYVFFFCLSSFGFSTAAVALVLVAFNPTIIAQARYVTTDGPMACLATIAVGELARYITGKSGKLGLLFMPLALSAAVLTKHSGLLLIPLFFVVVLVAVFKGVGRFAGLRRGVRFRRAALHALLTGAVLLVSVNALYKFNSTFLPIKEVLAATEPQYQVSQGYKQQLLEKNTPLGLLPQALPIPVPYTYVFGVACVRALNKGGFPSFFWGTPRSSGHVGYFPTVLTLKSPPSLLLFLLLGVVLARRRLPGEIRAHFRKIQLPTKVIFGVGGLFFGFLLSSKLNMGVRHGLLIMPLASILGGRAFAVAWEHYTENAFAKVTMLAAAGSTIFSAVTASPLYLGYFNFLAGTPENAHNISIYGEDWGQDRAAFAKYVKDNKISPLYYDVQTETRKVEFDHFKVPYTQLHCSTVPPAGSWIGIHALVVKRSKPDSKCNTWLKGRKPVARINEHVYLYWIGGTPTAPAVTPKGDTPTDDDDDEIPKEDPAF